MPTSVVTEMSTRLVTMTPTPLITKIPTCLVTLILTRLLSHARMPTCVVTLISIISTVFIVPLILTRLQAIIPICVYTVTPASTALVTDTGGDGAMEASQTHPHPPGLGQKLNKFRGARLPTQLSGPLANHPVRTAVAEEPR